MLHPLQKHVASLNFDRRNFHQKKNDVPTKYCVPISLHGNIGQLWKCVNKDFQLSHTENTYKMRNCFSVIKIHFSQSLKQYHPLSSALSTMDANYHWNFKSARVFLTGWRRGESVQQHISDFLFSWLLVSKHPFEAELQVIERFSKWAHQSGICQVWIDMFWGASKTAPSPPGGISFWGMFRMVSLDAECLFGRALISYTHYQGNSKDNHRFADEDLVQYVLNSSTDQRAIL